MSIKKNKTETITEQKNHRTLIKSSSTKKAGRKSFDDENLKSDKRNTFLLNAYQQEKMDKRMIDLGIRNKTDYILSLLKKDIKEL